ncbi:YbaK/aminoacyl-tRNA synthetase-associated domain-containing protein [Cladochytrium replicatum]|nr:YbaK/aminoacyl-tRNA synthetase-associated domain-containing protein [Cladochytrium replicatum]
MSDSLHIQALEEFTSKVSEFYAIPAVQKKYLLNHASIASRELDDASSSEGAKRVKAICKQLGLTSRFYEVESDYYDWPLQKRAFRLLAPSKAHLCKTVVFENTRHNPTSSLLDPTNSKYYCVIVQYVSKINTQKIMNFVRDLNNRSVSKKYYNMRLAPEEKSFELTGFENNAVSPIGMAQPIPVILSQSIMELQPPVVFLGAGHIDWKVAVPTEELVQKVKCFVADTS